ncbi:MAG TPA: carboxypeptidase regulatory-like domain-containing protein [Bryobacteraceae bacterium]|nr:carboxypeptidase regulatory-like domain-containing protein [Bryobacteraceae bacterium]
MSRIGCLMAISWLTVSVVAQTPTANIVGKVVDPTGAVIPGAKILVRQTDTNQIREVTTNGEGAYTVPNLSPGDYDITVELEGFRRLEERGITLQLDQTVRLELVMRVGSIAETLEVHASAPLLNTETAVKGDMIVSKEMVDIPLNGRDFADLAYLVPGVSQKAQGGNGSNFAVNGARTDNTNFTIDGFFNQNPKGGTAQARPTIDSMMEFKMQTTGYSAEYGRLAGGTLSMVLKSGTNRLHGALFEYLRNDALDARNYFDPEKTKLRRNQFGAVLDGPVYLPKLYKGKDRTFFLFSWEGYRQVNGTSNITRVPTALEREGDFSKSVNVNNQPANIPDPFDGGKTGACAAGKIGNCFPGNIVPKSRIDPIATNVMSYYPLPNIQSVNNYYSVSNDPDFWDSFVSKVDQRVRTTDNLSFRFLKRFNRNTNAYNGADVDGFTAFTRVHQSLAGLNYTWVIGPMLINETRFGFSRTDNHQTGNRMDRDYAGDWGLAGSTTDPQMAGFPLMKVTNYSSLGNAANLPINFDVNNYQVGDTVTWVRSRHLMKFGFDYLRTQYFQPYFNNNRGTYAFNGFWTTAPVADLELGVLNQMTRTVGTNPNYLFIPNWGFFVQDDFKVKPTLTLNLGLRYELPQPAYEKYGRLSNFVPELGQLLIASDKTVPNLQQLVNDAGLAGKVALAKDAGYPESLVFPYRKSFAPRVGFAWRPFAGDRTVVRGGYGIYWGGNLWNPIRNNLANVYPFTIAETHNKNTGNPALLTLQNPLGTKGNLNGVLTPNGIQSNPSPSYLQSWNLTVEREIGWESAVEISYVGSKGTHLGRQYNINMPLRDPLNPAGIRPIAGFNDINFFSFQSNSTYNAAMITWRKRVTRAMSFRLNYVYSKSIDYASQISDTADGSYTGAQDPRNLTLDRGRSDWDRGHSFTSIFTFDLPRISRGLPLRMSSVVNHWQIAGSGRFESGTPFTPQTSSAQLDLGEARRPNRIAKGTLANPTPDMWFDLPAFPQVPEGSFQPGTSGRNILDGPGMITLNVSLIRRIPLRERFTLQLRCEAFNMLNHPRFNLPNVNVNAPGGGTITAAGDPRLIQIGARLIF